MIREKQQKSGKLLEIDFYPVFDSGRAMPTRAPQSKASTAAQEKYNHIQAQKRAIRYVNKNFDETDNLIHTTFAAADAPLNKDAALKQSAKYIRRIKAEREKELKRVLTLLKDKPDDQKLIALKKKLSAPFKYYGRCEEIVYKSGEHKGKPNYHFHIFVTGGLDRDLLENLWPSNARVNADRFRPDKFGPEAAARYITKQGSGSSWTLRSKNLEKPDEPKCKDGYISHNQVHKMAKLRVDDAAYWEKKYKGYKFLRCYARFNEYNGNWYVSAVMYKTDQPITPEWNAPEWIVWK